jgi:mRNA export factor
MIQTMQSPLKFQSRCIAAFADTSGFALGSIEGRVAIQYLDAKNESYGSFPFVFRAHAENSHIYLI